MVARTPIQRLIDLARESRRSGKSLPDDADEIYCALSDADKAIATKALADIRRGDDVTEASKP